MAGHARVGALFGMPPLDLDLLQQSPWLPPVSATVSLPTVISLVIAPVSVSSITFPMPVTPSAIIRYMQEQCPPLSPMVSQLHEQCLTPFATVRYVQKQCPSPLKETVRGQYDVLSWQHALL